MADGESDLPDWTALKGALLAQLTAANEPPPLLHPSMADLYKTKVEQLAGALQREDSRLEVCCAPSPRSAG